jgi:TonB family protein
VAQVILQNLPGCVASKIMFFTRAKRTGSRLTFERKGKSRIAASANNSIISKTSKYGDVTSVSCFCSFLPVSLILGSMQSRTALSLLVCATMVIACSGFSPAQDEPMVHRKVVVRVAPSYPELALRTNIHGAVKLIVLIGSDGRVKTTEIVGGNPVLAQAAVDAVHKWKFEACPQPTKEVIELKFEPH